MNKPTLVFIIFLFLQGCALLGTKTLYKTKEDIKVNSIGYITLYCDSAFIKREFPFANTIFINAVDSTLREYGIQQAKYFELNICYKDQIIENLKSLCQNNSIDAVIVTTIGFTKVLPYGYYDTDVRMVLFDKVGKELIKTRHNTGLGNSTWKFPTIKMTIQFGVCGALKRMLEEMNYKKIS